MSQKLGVGRSMTEDVYHSLALLKVERARLVA